MPQLAPSSGRPHQRGPARADRGSGSDEAAVSAADGHDGRPGRPPKGQLLVAVGLAGARVAGVLELTNMVRWRGWSASR